MTRDAVMNKLSENEDELRSRFAVESLALFGSVARNEAADASDVDLLVEFNRPVGLLHVIGTRQHIEQLLGVAHVDLVLRRAVLPELQEDILAEAVDAF